MDKLADVQDWDQVANENHALYSDSHDQWVNLTDSPTPDSHSEYLRQVPCEGSPVEQTKQLSYDPALFTDEVTMPHRHSPLGKFHPGHFFLRARLITRPKNMTSSSHSQ